MMVWSVGETLRCLREESSTQCYILVLSFYLLLYMCFIAIRVGRFSLLSLSFSHDARKISLTTSSFSSALPSLGESEFDSEARGASPPFLDKTTGAEAWMAFKSTDLFTARFSSSFPELDFETEDGLFAFRPLGDLPPFFSLSAFFNSSRGMRAS